MTMQSLTIVTASCIKRSTIEKMLIGKIEFPPELSTFFPHYKSCLLPENSEYNHRPCVVKMARTRKYQSKAAIISAYYGYVDLLQYLMENNDKICSHKIIYWAVTNHHFDCFNYAIQHNCRYPSNLVRVAAKAGNLRILEYLVQTGGYNMTIEAFRDAASHNHVECANFINQTYVSKTSYPPFSLGVDVIKHVTKHRFFGVLSLCSLDEIHNVMVDSTHNCDMNLIIRLYEYGIPMPSTMINSLISFATPNEIIWYINHGGEIMDTTLSMTIIFNKPNITRLFVEKYKIKPTDHDVITLLTYGMYELLPLFYGRIKRWPANALKIACGRGPVESVKYLIDHGVQYDPYINASRISDDIFAVLQPFAKSNGYVISRH